MANVRIIEQPEITTLSGGEFLVTDSQAAGTKKITPANLVAAAGGAGVSDELKTALLQLASKVAYIDEDGQEYYQDLYDALYDTTWQVTNTLSHCSSNNAATSVTKNGSYSATITASAGYTLTGATVSITMGGSDITASAYNNGTISIASVTGALVISISAAAKTVSSISAVYTQSGTVYDTDSLDSLKSDLVVTATYSDSSTETVPSADYTLSGSMAHGTNTITVTYEGITTTFSVTVSEHWTYSIGDLTRASGAMVKAAAADCGSALAETTNNRYSFFRNSGSTSFAIQRNNAITSQTSGYYPIKVPQGATALTVTITPSTQYVAVYLSKLNNGKYETWTPTTGSSSYTEHETSFTFDAADDNCYISMTTKYNSAGTSYPTAPTGLDIVFS